MTNNDKLGVGIVGLGLVAAEHTKGYLNNHHCEIVGLCSRDKNKAKAKAEQLGLLNCKAYDHFEDMLKSDEIDLVSVCTPNNLHVEQGISVAQSGKHLVMEKPIALNIEDARKLEKYVRESNIKNVVCFVLHWYPSVVNQMALINSGIIGDVFLADCEYLHGHLERYPTQWRWIWKKEMGGSTLMQGGIHAVDMMRQFVSSDAVEVTAYSHGHTEKYEYNPTITGIVKFNNGAIAKLTSSFETEMPYQLNVRLYGTKGTIQNQAVWSSEIAPRQNDWADFPAIGPDSGDPSHHPFSPMVDSIVNSILNDTTCSPDITDAVKSHEIAFAADISAEQGISVKLPL